MGAARGMAVLFSGPSTRMMRADLGRACCPSGSPIWVAHLGRLGGAARLQNYEYIGDLGSGSYGFVWKCMQRSSGRIVAVKGFKLAHTDKKFLDQAIREVRMLRASCDHPNVVQLLEAFRSSSGRVYMVFEYVDRCLSSELHKRFTCGLPAAQTRLVLWQLLSAVAHLHSKKIIHRDIKPGNLLLTSDGVLKLCDFGFARTTRGEPYQPDRFSSYVVTRWYRSPEMLVSDLYSAASDIWSLGCTFAEIATGRPLFPGTSSLDQLWRIMRCLGSLPPSQAERFAAAATAAGLPEPPPPPPRGKSLWQRLPELETRLLDVVQACLRLDPLQRPTAAQLLQMPYFWEIPKLIAGTHLETVYSEYGAANQRVCTASSRAGQQPAAPQQQTVSPTAAAAAAASRGFAVKVMSSSELVREVPADKNPTTTSLLDAGGDGRSSKRPQSVLLSSVAASLLGEPPPPPGGSGSVQLLPLLSAPAPQAAPPPPQQPAPKSLDVGPAAVGVTAMPPPPRSVGAAAVESPRVSSGVSANGLPGQPPSSSPSPLPQPPATSRVRSGTSPRSLPLLTQQTSRRRLVSMTAMPTTTAAAAPAATALRASAASTSFGAGAAVESTPPLGTVELFRMAGVNDRQGGKYGSTPTSEQRTGRPVTGKRLADRDGTAVSEPGGGRAPLEPSPPQAATAAAAGSGSDEMMSGFGAGASAAGMGLLPDTVDDGLSDGEGHISEDDELMKYFAAKSAGSGVAAAGGAAAAGAAGASRRAVTVPSSLPALPPSSAAASTEGTTAASSGGGVTSSTSMKRLPVDGLHAGVRAVHHSLYGNSRQGSGSAGSAVVSLGGAVNRRMAAMVMRTVDVPGGGDGTAAAAAAAAGDGSSPQSIPIKLPKRATVGSYLTIPPQAQQTAGEPSTLEASASAAGGTRPRTAGIGGTSVGMQHLHALQGGLPALHAPHGPHAIAATTETGLAANAPHSSVVYGRISVPVSGYGTPVGPYQNASAQMWGVGRHRALSRQGSVVFNQLMYDALPEIGTPGGAPEVPSGTPPRRRIVMSGFTPCRTAAARAAAEGIPPAAAMAAVLGEVLQSTTDISVAYSPIHVARSVDLTSPDRDSVITCDTATGINHHSHHQPGGAASTAMPVRRANRRQGSLALLADPSSSSVSPGGPSYVNSGVGGAGVASAAGHPAVANGDPGLMLGSSAPTFYHRTQRHPELPGAAAAAISSGVPAHPVAIVVGGGGRIPLALGSTSGAASISPGAGSIGLATATPPSGARGFSHMPMNLAARSRLASGNMVRDGQVPSGTTLYPEGTASTDLEGLGTWPGAVSSPAGGGGGGNGGSAVLTQQALPPPPPVPSSQQQQQQQHPSHLGPPPPTRGRLGRWASGLIDSLPEDREVLHAAYRDWHGIYCEAVTERDPASDEAIQTLGGVDWAPGRESDDVRNGGGNVASPPPQLSSPRAPGGPYPPGGSAPVPRSGDPRGATGAAAAAAPPSYAKSSSASFPRPASPLVLPMGAIPRSASGRSRRNLQVAAAAAATAAAAPPPQPTLPGVAGAASPLFSMSRSSSSGRREGPLSTGPSAPSRMRQSDAAVTTAAVVPSGGRERPASTGGAGNSSGGGSGVGERRSGSSSGKWPKAKALLGGRFLSSLVRRFKETTSDK